MPYSIKIIKYGLAICALALAPFFFTRAETITTMETDGVKSELSRLTEGLELLAVIKAGKRGVDATSLQTALNTVIRLSEKEIQNVSMGLVEQDTLNDAQETARDILITKIIDLKNHIKAVQTDTTQEAAPSAIISIAQKFKEWRDGPYAATIGQAVQFVGVFENENSIKAANARLNAILKDERKIRALLSASKTAPFMRARKNAQNALKKAADLNARAQALLMPDAEITEDEGIIEEIIRESNTLVTTAYDDFIAMSRLIKK